uniref:Putative trichohyalin-plectin-similarity domain protein n=1 Tax=Xenopsylla cheopis TaxID=163159 RepID=A0A6M2DS20_XENCH
MADSGGEKGIIADNKAGAAPTGDALRHSRPSSVNKGRRRVRPMSMDATPINAHTMHWFAYLGPEPAADQAVQSDANPQEATALNDGHLSDGENEDVRRSTNFDAENNDPGGASAAGSRDRPATDERLRHVRDRQQEERQRRLEELRAQALAAQKFREQKEEERRKRIEEMRLRDNDRRSQVEERKKAIWEAERDRREAILRKNQEREARMETKRKNDRSNIVFAFGSSTPRMLEPADTGGSFWGHRRATSTTNVTFTAAPLTRRSSERELDGSKKRATSAGGLDRQPGEDRMATSMYEVFSWNEQQQTGASNAPVRVPVRRSVTPGSERSLHKRYSLAVAPHSTIDLDDEQTDGVSMPVSYQRTVVRRRTDLVPTIPSPRDTSSHLHGSRGSLSQHHGRSSGAGLRSGELTPSLSGSSSRPGSALSTQNASSLTGTVVRRPASAPRRPRPASIAGTGVTAENVTKHGMNGEKPKTAGDKDGASKPPLPKVHAAPRKSVPSKPETPKRTTTEKLSRPNSVKASPKLTPKATPLQSPGDGANKPDIANISKQVEVTNTTVVKTEIVNGKTDVSVQEEQTVITTGDVPAQGTNTEQQEPIATVSVPADGKTAIEPPKEDAAKVVGESIKITQEFINAESVKEEDVPQVTTVSEENDKAVPVHQPKAEPSKNEEAKAIDGALTENGDGVDMTASMIAKTRITTEEEAKAALAERRRLAREEAERQAELERRRQREAEEAELKRQREEEEKQRRLEEETLRLAEEQRKAEEQRLLQAIEETRQREQEEARRREEEIRQKAEREEQERKAREEAEKQREEMAKRLEQEEKEREARRKRVEAIMLRTRSKANNSATSTPNKAENDDKSPSEDNSKPNTEQSDSDQQTLTSSMQESFDKSVTEKENALFNSSIKLNNTPAPPANNGFQVNSDLVNKNNNQLNGDNLFKNDNENEKQSQNGHRNGPDLIDNTVEQNNTTNTLLDLSEFDNLANNTSTNVTNLKNAMQIQHSELITDMMTGVDGIIDLVDATNSNGQATIPPPIICFTDNSDNRDLSLL